MQFSGCFINLTEIESLRENSKTIFHFFQNSCLHHAMQTRQTISFVYVQGNSQHNHSKYGLETELKSLFYLFVYLNSLYFSIMKELSNSNVLVQSFNRAIN